MRPRRQPEVTFRDLADGETMLLSADGQQATVLNPLGAVVWQLCDGGHSVQQIAAFIGEHFPDQSLARITADVTALIEALIEARLVYDEDPCGASPSGS